ncbi:MAG: DNA translocase FtsK 4TM domain-containing protein [Betaproteobacteria bacterium]|nr:DNA translocase FtsK 4TM domain-containing protein [Betaproteobacteria bacterium]
MSKSGAEASLRLRPLLLLREAAIIIAVVLGAYVYISLGSYRLADIDAGSHQIANIGGRLGSYIAHGFFYLFGNSAYLAVAVVICSTWLLLGQIARDRSRYWAASAITGLLLLLVCTSSLEALHFTAGSDDLPHQRSGGILGFSVANSLFYALGFHGTTLILAGCWLAGLSLFANFSWIEACDLVGALAEKGYRRTRPMFAELLKIFFVLREQIPRPSKSPPATPAIRPTAAAPVAKSAAEPQFSAPPDRPAVATAVASSTPPAGSVAAPVKSATAKRRTSKAQMPTASLLSPITSTARKLSEEQLQAMAESIRSKLEEFGVLATVREILPGPVVTRYEIEPATGVKGIQIVNLARDLSRALGVASIRVLESIPGKTTMGLEVPNEQREMVSLQDVINSGEFTCSASPISLALGRDIAGTPLIADLERMPHLLAAGTTGSGKSVQINSLILSLLFKSTPDDVRLILIDPKVVEMGVYEGLPHLLAPVVTNMDLVPSVLGWCIGEMERRYRLMAEYGVRNISGLNALAAKGTTDPESGEPLVALPRIVMIIDELADLMMVSGKKVEQQISRLAQKARAAGVHLILATQRPSVNVITGLIKANIPSRIAFQVSSKIDSRTIIDQGGAETLLGLGDMLFLPGGTASPIRVHGAYVSDADVHKVVGHVKQQYADDEYETIDFAAPVTGDAADAGSQAGSDNGDELYDQAVEVVRKHKRASISLVQRHLRIGYNRAARLVEQMEVKGVVSGMDESGSRRLLDN